MGLEVALEAVEVDDVVVCALGVALQLDGSG